MNRIDAHVVHKVLNALPQLINVLVLPAVHKCGRCLAHVWPMFGLCLDYVWQCVWAVCGLCLGYVWPNVGTPVKSPLGVRLSLDP